jgi:hypothetical protein
VSKARCLKLLRQLKHACATRYGAAGARGDGSTGWWIRLPIARRASIRSCFCRRITSTFDGMRQVGAALPAESIRQVRVDPHLLVSSERRRERLNYLHKGERGKTRRSDNITVSTAVGILYYL